MLTVTRIPLSDCTKKAPACYLSTIRKFFVRLARTRI